MSALDQKISAIQAFFEQYPFLKNEFPMLIDGLKSVKTKAEGGDDSTNEAATGAPDTLPTYTGLGIIKIDKCPATYEVKGKDKPIKLNKGDQIKIKNVSGSEIEADYYSQKKGHITIKVDKVNVILTKDNLQDIQNLPKTDIVVTHKDLDTRIDWIDHTNFIAGWQITPSSPNLYINLSKVDTCFHRGLAHIADKLHILQLGNGQTFIGDKPLDVNSLVVGSIDFNQTKVSDWKAKYQWTDDDCNNFAGKEIAFRFTCFMQEKKKVILVEKIGEVQRTNLSKTELANLKNQTYKNTTFDVNKLKGTHNYVKLNSNQEKDVLESLSKIPQEFQSYLEGVNIVFDTNPPQGEQAHIGEQQGERVFSFSANAFIANEKDDIVTGDTGGDTFTHLDGIVFHELAHLIDLGHYYKAKDKAQALVDEAERKRVDAHKFAYDRELDKFCDNIPYAQDIPSKERIVTFMNECVLAEEDQLDISWSEDKLRTELKKKQKTDYIPNSLYKIVENKKKDLIANLGGITIPSGKYFVLDSNNSWTEDSNYQPTDFRTALAQDGDKITEYAKTNDAEAFAECFALFMTQPNVMKDISPNLYAYFDNKKYAKHKAHNF